MSGSNKKISPDQKGPGQQKFCQKSVSRRLSEQGASVNASEVIEHVIASSVRLEWPTRAESQGLAGSRFRHAHVLRCPSDCVFRRRERA